MYIDMDFHVCQLGDVFLAAAGAFFRERRSWCFVTRTSFVEVLWAAAGVFLVSGKNDAPWSL